MPRKAAFAATTLVALLALAATTVSAQPRWSSPVMSAPVCPANMRVCSGSYGRQCYSPASGQVCRDGIVCQSGQQICSGQFGASCYSAASGQSCQQGMICSAGQLLCTANGAPHCITPANGESCQ